MTGPSPDGRRDCGLKRDRPDLFVCGFGIDQLRTRTIGVPDGPKYGARQPHDQGYCSVRRKKCQPSTARTSIWTSEVMTSRG